MHAFNAGTRYGKLQATTGDANIELKEEDGCWRCTVLDEGFPSAVLQVR